MDAPHEDRIRALASGGMSHQSMFFTIGPTCLSTDEIFISKAYQVLQQEYIKEQAAYAKLVKLKEVEVKAKALLNKEWLVVADYKNLLRWKLGDEYSEATKNMRAEQLKQLWEAKKDIEINDIDLPPPPLPPAIPSAFETLLGEKVRKNLTK